MTDQQLYIDGVLMDLPESTDVVLDIKSNLFRDVTKMTSNYTYTIQLPRTVHNLSVLQQADRPKSGSRYPLFSTSAVISVEVYKLSRTDD